MAAVVDTVDAVFQAWLCPHVGQEILKAMVWEKRRMVQRPKHIPSDNIAA
jgi:hypothetical protein